MTHTTASDQATLPNGAPIDAVPLALRKRKQWVLWRLEPDPKKPGKLTKVPYIDLGHNAQSNNPRTWVSFNVALARWRANPKGWSGIGYILGKDDPYTGLDFDGCLNPTTGFVAPWADTELALILPTYAEISPSGTGIKVFVETTRTHTLGSGKDGKDAGQIEVYSTGRWFAVTGLAFEDAPPTIAKVDDAIIEQIIAREQVRRHARRPPAIRTESTGHAASNGGYPSLALADLAHLLERLHPDRWAAYDDWLRIGMALHAWAGGDAHRLQTAFALFDQYSKERAPDLYGGTEEKWASFGKRSADARPVTIGTLIGWVKQDDPPVESSQSEAPHPADTIDDADEPEPVIAIAPSSSFPELPESAHIDPGIGSDACPWLDSYVAFSRLWSPRSYEDFHEACGLWVLSTVAARRVLLPLGGERFTSLYIALCARTSIWAKSTAAKIAMETIRAAGLSQLLAPDNATPQAFIRDLAERLPNEWDELPEPAQREILARLAFAGQKGWFYEEYGEHLAAMMREGSSMADYRGHLRRFDDCPPQYTYSTIARGMNTVQRPYLALLANLTPTDLAPFAKKGGALWGDGFFARYAFVAPPAGARRGRERFPDGWRTIPDALSRPLRTWHEQLGIPDASVDARTDSDDKPTGSYDLLIEPVAPQHCTLGTGVFDAYYRYLDALADLVDVGGNVDLDGSYTRFAEKALRIAMLLASFSNGGRIEIEHWARAQAITERWRRSLHHLVDQIGVSDESPERKQEDKIDRLLAEHGALTARDAGRFLHISSGEAEYLLDRLVRAGKLSVESGKRTKRYRSTAASVTTVTVSQVSHPSKIVTVTEEPRAMGEEVSQNLECVTVVPSDTCDTFHNEAPSFIDRPEISIRLRLVDATLYKAGWRVAQEGDQVRLFLPAGPHTDLYDTLEAAARSAAIL